MSHLLGTNYLTDGRLDADIYWSTTANGSDRITDFKQVDLMRGVKYYLIIDVRNTLYSKTVAKFILNNGGGGNVVPPATAGATPSYYTAELTTGKNNVFTMSGENWSSNASAPKMNNRQPIVARAEVYTQAPATDSLLTTFFNTSTPKAELEASLTIVPFVPPRLMWSKVNTSPSHEFKFPDEHENVDNIYLMLSRDRNLDGNKTFGLRWETETPTGTKLVSGSGAFAGTEAILFTFNKDRYLTYTTPITAKAHLQDHMFGDWLLQATINPPVHGWESAFVSNVNDEYYEFPNEVSNNWWEGNGTYNPGIVLKVPPAYSGRQFAITINASHKGTTSNMVLAPKATSSKYLTIAQYGDGSELLKATQYPITFDIEVFDNVSRTVMHTNRIRLEDNTFRYTVDVKWVDAERNDPEGTGISSIDRTKRAFLYARNTSLYSSKTMFIKYNNAIDNNAYNQPQYAELPYDPGFNSWGSSGNGWVKLAEYNPINTVYNSFIGNPINIRYTAVIPKTDVPADRWVAGKHHVVQDNTISLNLTEPMISPNQFDVGWYGDQAGTRRITELNYRSVAYLIIQNNSPIDVAFKATVNANSAQPNSGDHHSNTTVASGQKKLIATYTHTFADAGTLTGTVVDTSYSGGLRFSNALTLTHNVTIPSKWVRSRSKSALTDYVDIDANANPYPTNQEMNVGVKLDFSNFRHVASVRITGTVRSPSKAFADINTTLEVGPGKDNNPVIWSALNKNVSLVEGTLLTFTGNVRVNGSASPIVIRASSSNVTVPHKTLISDFEVFWSTTRDESGKLTSASNTIEHVASAAPLYLVAKNINNKAATLVTSTAGAEGISYTHSFNTPISASTKYTVIDTISSTTGMSGYIYIFGIWLKDNDSPQNNQLKALKIHTPLVWVNRDAWDNRNTDSANALAGNPGPAIVAYFSPSPYGIMPTTLGLQSGDDIGLFVRSDLRSRNKCFISGEVIVTYNHWDGATRPNMSFISKTPINTIHNITRIWDHGIGSHFLPYGTKLTANLVMIEENDAGEVLKINRIEMIPNFIVESWYPQKLYIAQTPAPGTSVNDSKTYFGIPSVVDSSDIGGIIASPSPTAPSFRASSFPITYTTSKSKFYTTGARDINPNNPSVIALLKNIDPDIIRNNETFVRFSVIGENNSIADQPIPIAITEHHYYTGGKTGVIPRYTRGEPYPLLWGPRVRMYYTTDNTAVCKRTTMRSYCVAHLWVETSVDIELTGAVFINENKRVVSKSTGRFSASTQPQLVAAFDLLSPQFDLGTDINLLGSFYAKRTDRETDLVEASIRPVLHVDTTWDIVVEAAVTNTPTMFNNIDKIRNFTDTFGPDGGNVKLFAIANPKRHTAASLNNTMGILQYTADIENGYVGQKLGPLTFTSVAGVLRSQVFNAGIRTGSNNHPINTFAITRDITNGVVGNTNPLPGTRKIMAVDKWKNFVPVFGDILHHLATANIGSNPDGSRSITAPSLADVNLTMTGIKIFFPTVTQIRVIETNRSAQITKPFDFESNQFGTVTITGNEFVRAHLANTNSNTTRRYEVQYLDASDNVVHTELTIPNDNFNNPYVYANRLVKWFNQPSNVKFYAADGYLDVPALGERIVGNMLSIVDGHAAIGKPLHFYAKNESSNPVGIRYSIHEVVGDPPYSYKEIIIPPNGIQHLGKLEHTDTVVRSASTPHLGSISKNGSTPVSINIHAHTDNANIPSAVEPFNVYSAPSIHFQSVPMDGWSSNVTTLEYDNNMLFDPRMVKMYIRGKERMFRRYTSAEVVVRNNSGMEVFRYTATGANYTNMVNAIKTSGIFMIPNSSIDLNVSGGEYRYTASLLLRVGDKYHRDDYLTGASLNFNGPI